jgi:hypothetical protein
MLPNQLKETTYMVNVSLRSKNDSNKTRAASCRFINKLQLIPYQVVVKTLNIQKLADS